MLVLSILPFLSSPKVAYSLYEKRETGEPFLVFDHVSWATRIHEPLVLQASVHHLHKMRRGQWLSAGVSEIKLRNPTLNHVT
jgi:hypothetical protein